MNYREAWANGEIEAGTLVDAIEEQAREIERLQLTCNDIDDQNDRIYAELAALKEQPSGVVLPLMAALESVVHDERVPNEVSQEVAAVLIEARRLNSSPVSAGDDRETIRAVFLRNGFTIKEGQADLKPYVYAAADELMSIARAALSAPSHGEQVRHMVLAGWKLVPVEPTPEMISAAEEAHMPFGDMDIALRCALFAAPSAGSHKEQGE